MPRLDTWNVNEAHLQKVLERKALQTQEFVLPIRIPSRVKTFNANPIQLGIWHWTLRIGKELKKDYKNNLKGLILMRE